MRTKQQRERPEPVAPDAQEIPLQLRWRPGNVAMTWATPTSWLAFTPEQAISIGRELIAFGQLAAGGNGGPRKG